MKFVGLAPVTWPKRLSLNLEMDPSVGAEFPGPETMTIGGFAMQVPLQISFEHVEQSDAIEARIRDETEKLEQFYPRLTSARVVIARPQNRHHKGDTYAVRIHLTVPGAPDLVVNRDPGETGAHEDAYVTIRDAFNAARRQLQDLVRERQDNVKNHETPSHG